MYHVNASNLPGNDISRTFEGGKHGPCSVLFFLVHNRPGEGPSMHHHAYDETFVILEGHVAVVTAVVQGGGHDGEAFAERTLRGVIQEIDRQPDRQ